MLLKCRYLAQFSMSELTKNAAVISKAQVQCPFMSHAVRTLSTNVTNAEKDNQETESNYYFRQNNNIFFLIY